VTADHGTLQRARQQSAQDVLRLDIMQTPFLGVLRQDAQNPAGWDLADEQFHLLSHGQQVIYGWLRYAVWPTQGYPCVATAADAVARCATDEQRQTVRDAWETLTALNLAEAGVTT